MSQAHEWQEQAKSDPRGALRMFDTLPERARQEIETASLAAAFDAFAGRDGVRAYQELARYPAELRRRLASAACARLRAVAQESPLTALELLQVMGHAARADIAFPTVEIASVWARASDDQPEGALLALQELTEVHACVQPTDAVLAFRGLLNGKGQGLGALSLLEQLPEVYRKALSPDDVRRAWDVAGEWSRWANHHQAHTWQWQQVRRLPEDVLDQIGAEEIVEIWLTLVREDPGEAIKELRPDGSRPPMPARFRDAIGPRAAAAWVEYAGQGHANALQLLCDAGPSVWRHVPPETVVRVWRRRLQEDPTEAAAWFWRVGDDPVANLFTLQDVLPLLDPQRPSSLVLMLPERLKCALPPGPVAAVIRCLAEKSEEGREEALQLLEGLPEEPLCEVRKTDLAALLQHGDPEQRLRTLSRMHRFPAYRAAVGSPTSLPPFGRR
jgi:hypothetical protein